MIVIKLGHPPTLTDKWRLGWYYRQSQTYCLYNIRAQYVY